MERQRRCRSRHIGNSHLRFVAKLLWVSRYGLPVADLIEGTNDACGQKFERKGFRLATYAMWWIKAAIQEYILGHGRLSKLAPPQAEKAIFHLCCIKGQIQAIDDGDPKPEQVTQIATA